MCSQMAKEPKHTFCTDLLVKMKFNTFWLKFPLVMHSLILLISESTDK